MPFALDKLRLNALDASGDYERIKGLCKSMNLALSGGKIVGSEFEENRFGQYSAKYVEAQEGICSAYHEAVNQFLVAAAGIVQRQRELNDRMRTDLDVLLVANSVKSEAVP